MATTPAKHTPAKVEDKKDGKTLDDLLANKETSKIDNAASKNKDPEVKNDKEVEHKPEDAIGPEGDETDRAYVFPKDIKDPVDNTDKSVGYATPDQLNAETAEQTKARYGYSNEVSEEDLDNPRVKVYRDTLVNQIPSGTHLHPDIARDLLNRGIAEQTTDNARVTRMVTEVYDFAPDAPNNDKFVKPENSDDK